MTWQKWLIIIARILIIIAQGTDVGEAVSQAATTFGVDADEIFKRGGF